MIVREEIKVPADYVRPEEANELTFYYTNYKGEYSKRRVNPYTIRLIFGVCPYHDGAQWFMHAFDMDKGALRTFAFKDIGEKK